MAPRMSWAAREAMLEREKLQAIFSYWTKKPTKQLLKRLMRAIDFYEKKARGEIPASVPLDTPWELSPRQELLGLFRHWSINPTDQDVFADLADAIGEYQASAEKRATYAA